MAVQNTSLSAFNFLLFLSVSATHLQLGEFGIFGMDYRSHTFHSTLSTAELLLFWVALVADCLALYVASTFSASLKRVSVEGIRASAEIARASLA